MIPSLQSRKLFRSKLFVFFVLILASLALVSCSSVANIPPAKEAVLQGMRDAGFKFDSTLVTVTGEESLEESKVSGPMIGPKEIPEPGTEAPEKGSDNYTEYTDVLLNMQDGQWIVVSAVIKEVK